MEIVIQDEELSKEIEELKEPSKVWSKFPSDKNLGVVG